MSFLTTLQRLDRRKQVMLAAAVLGTVVALFALTRLATRPPMALLYAGLDAQAAGEVVAALDAEGVAYRVEGQRVLVAAPERDRLRLRLAQEGLPRQAASGYELLDDLSGFSTTSDMFSAAYWRAKEGELTRTLLGLPGVRAARVHIGTEAQSGFTRSAVRRTASVTLTAPGGLSASQVKAVQHLTALAVAGLAPVDVAVVEAGTGLLTGDEEEDAATDETARAAALEADLVRLLEARVGRGNARVSVAMTLSREREAWSAREMDPASAVVTERSVRESTQRESAQEGAVTVASDLPDGDANAGAEAAPQTEQNETREETRYDYAVTDREGERLPGAVTALSVAVLVNDLPPGEDGAAAPRPADELEALRLLLEAAAGIDPARGDRLTLRSLPFDVPVLEEVEVSPLAGREAQLWQAGQVGFLGLVALALGLLVVRPLLSPSAAPEAVALLEPVATPTEDPLSALRKAAISEPEAAAALLNSWLDEETA